MRPAMHRGRVARSPARSRVGHVARPLGPPQLRSLRRARAGGMGESTNKAGDMELERDVTESSAAIDAMMRDVGNALLVDAGANYITGEATRSDDHRRLIAAAVSPRLDQLNSTFVPVLDAYIGSAQEAGPSAAAVVEVLLALREEVLAQLGQRLPVEMRVLSAALELQDADARVDLLRQHTQGQADPPCDLSALERAACQLVDDIEQQGEVPDRRLLARLCLAREELQQLVDETGGSTGPGLSQGQGASRFTTLRAVPRETVAFLKEVMKMPQSQRRRAALERAFREDWSGGAASGEADGAGAADPGAVRPGRVLDSVKALQAELLGPQYAGEGEGGVDPAVLQRLEEVRREALVVLMDLAGGEYSM